MKRNGRKVKKERQKGMRKEGMKANSSQLKSDV